MKRFSALLLAVMLALTAAAVPAFALEYDFSAQAPGAQFYRATTAGEDAAADSPEIVVGSDGTISDGSSPASIPSPLSVLDLPVGEYPDAWGITTDIAIAQNSIFPNAFAPTTQWSGILGWAGYDPLKVNSGALPTGAEMNLAAAAGTYAATCWRAMPAIAPDGAIGRLSIPSVNLNRYIYEGATTASMAKGLAHFDCTPGWDGNVCLAGHNRNSTSTAAFQHLKDVTEGTLVYYTTAYGTRTYRVSSISFCSTSDTSGLVQDGTSRLTLYTCKAGDSSMKLKVVATLIG